MIVAIIAVLIGLLLIGAGGYYFIKEKSDKESRKIYMITLNYSRLCHECG